MSRIAAFFVRNSAFSVLTFAACLALGYIALTSMPRGEDPPFGAPIFVITAVYPGTSPADMEQLIAEPLEDELYNLDDVTTIRTTLLDGVMVMRLEFEFGVNVENKNNDVVREVNAVRPDLPAGLVRLDVERAASDDVVVLQAAIVSDVASDSLMIALAEDLERRLEGVPGTKWVDVDAQPTQEVEVSLDLERMTRYGLSLDRVLGALQASNFNVPGGSIDLGERRFGVKTNSEFRSLDDVRAAVVSAGADGGLLTLGDVASVRLRSSADAPRARFSGQRAVWVLQAVVNEANLVNVRVDIQDRLESFGESLPDDVKLAIAFDNAASVNHRLGSLARDFAIALALVMLTLLPLGPRAAIVVMITIPLSMGIGLAVLYFGGYTLNQLSIVGLVVALGLVVDDAIVVVENIERHLRDGMNRVDAAIAATRELGVAVVGCTLVLLLAFLPLANLPAGAGEFITSLPMAVIVTVGASLFVAVTLAPWLASRILSKVPHQEGNVFLRAFDRYLNKPYQRILVWGMAHPVITLVLAALVFGASLTLIPRLGFSLFPASERPMFMVDIEATPGATLDETDRAARRVENMLLRQPEVASLNINVGSGHPRVYYNTIQGAFQPDFAQGLVQLHERLTLPELNALTDRLQDSLGNIAEARVTIRRFAQGPPVEAPLEFRIIGPNLDTLESLANRVETIVANMPGTETVRNNLRIPRTDLAVQLDWEKAGRYGLAPAAVARAVRFGMVGLPAGALRTPEGEEYELVAGIGQRSGADALRVFDEIAVPNVQGQPVALSQVANLALAESAPLIRHIDKQRFTAVTAFAKTGFNTFALIDAIESQATAEIKLPPGYQIVAAGEAETQAESTGGLGPIILLATFGILAVLVLEFRTFKSTLIVLSVVPLGIVGGLLALWLTGESLGFVAIVGMIALVGIEIKNSILMVDYTNQLRERGVPLREAVLDGAETRFLPILLTAATAIGGLIPIALENNPLVSPLAFVLIGGLVSSTMLSRIVTPVLYALLPPRVEVTGESHG